MEPDKVSLPKAHLQGDQRAFEQLIRTHADSLFGYLMRICRNRQNAEDLFQQSFMNAHLKADTLEDPGKFKSWFFAIATRLAIDAARKEKRDKKLLDHYDHNRLSQSTLETNPLKLAHLTEQKMLVRKALLKLPAGQRAAVVLTYYQGMSYKEASEALGCTLGTIKTQIFRALRQLAKLLPEGHGNEL